MPGLFSGGTTDVNTGRSHIASDGALQRRTVKMGLGLYGAIFVKGVPRGSYPFSCPSVSLFDLGEPVSSSRPGD